MYDDLTSPSSTKFASDHTVNRHLLTGDGAFPDGGRDPNSCFPDRPNIDIARAFVAAYFGDATARFRVSLLPCAPNLPKAERQKYPAAPANPPYEYCGTIDEIWPGVTWAVTAGYSVYLFANDVSPEIDHPYVKDSDIVRVRSLHVDCDSGLPGYLQKPGTPSTWHLPPSLIVRSSTVLDGDVLVAKGQAYWLLADDMPLAEFQGEQQRLIARYQSDTQVCDLKRILRLPGSVHRKPAVSRQEMQELQRQGLPVPLTAPQLVTFEGDGRRYARAQIVAGLPLKAEKPKKERAKKERTHDVRQPDSDYEPKPLELAMSDLARINAATCRLDLTSNPHGGWFPIVRAWGNTKFAGWDDPERGPDIRRRAREAIRDWMGGERFYRPYTAEEKKHFQGAYRAEWEDDYETAYQGDYTYGTIVARVNAERDGAADFAEHVRETPRYTPPGAADPISSKFLHPESEDRGDFEMKSVSDLVYAQSPAPARRDLVPDWMGAGYLFLIKGPGGYHKSRLILQLYFSKLYDQPLFRQVAGEGKAPWGNQGPCGGIGVGRFEALFYEDNDEDGELHRRVEAMVGARLYRVPERGSEADPTDRFKYGYPREPLLTVEDSGKIELTPTGKRMLRRWESMAGEEHMLIWLDSYFDAIDMSEGARNDDRIARRVITILNHWCRLLNATIICPFHASRSGQQNQHSGYAPAFDAKIRLGATVTAITEKVTDGERNETKQTGEFAYTITKWSGGPQGKRLVYRYSDGELVTETAMHQVDKSEADVAAELILGYTYGNYRTVLADALDEDKFQAIERAQPNRLRRKRGGHGDKWELTKPHDAEFSVDHWLVQEFRTRTNNPKAKLADFINALFDAMRRGDLDYRDAQREVSSSSRLPAGFFAGGELRRRLAQEVVDTAEADLKAATAAEDARRREAKGEFIKAISAIVEQRREADPDIGSRVSRLATEYCLRAGLPPGASIHGMPEADYSEWPRSSLALEYSRVGHKVGSTVWPRSVKRPGVGLGRFILLRRVG